MKTTLSSLTPTTDRRNSERRNFEQTRMKSNEREERRHIDYFAEGMIAWPQTPALTERRNLRPTTHLKHASAFRLRDWGLYAFCLAFSAALILLGNSVYLDRMMFNGRNLPLAAPTSDGFYHWQGYHRTSPIPSSSLFGETQ